MSKYVFKDGKVIVNDDTFALLKRRQRPKSESGLIIFIEREGEGKP